MTRGIVRRENGGWGFVSRAEGKIADAVIVFGFDFDGKTVLDIGSSTGGFTELALNMGAAKVIAVEKGTRQMKAPLRYDKRIELHEKTDIFDVMVGSEKSEKVRRKLWIERVDVVLADVSFVSLKKVLAYAKRCLIDENTDLLVMLKPQFEAKEWQLVRGVVKNEKIRREIIKEFENWLKINGYVVIQKRDNNVVGKNGNKERFYWLKLAKMS